MMQSDEEYYWEYCTGGKTGFTSQCLNTLVTYAEKDGRRLVSVILQSKQEPESTMNHARFWSMDSTIFLL